MRRADVLVAGRFRTRLAVLAVLSRLDHPVLLEVVCAGFRLPPNRVLARGGFFGCGSLPDVDRLPAELTLAGAGPPVLRLRSIA